LPGELLEQKQPGLVVILAWRYADPIASRHRAYLEAGGRFVVQLPDLREISAADYSK
jgi:C-methyltransferase C-terminal domain